MRGFALLFVLLSPILTFAQSGDQSLRSPQPPEGSAPMAMGEMADEGLPSPHASSGTGWQPASVPDPMWMLSRAGWELMAHGTIFVTYNQQGGPRGEGKAESVNYLMTMEQHRLGRGKLLLRQMFSAESLTSPHPGFPELFQTGETYHGEPLVDHQHPHNVFAELAALYTVPINGKISWLLYGGPSAEPALGNLSSSGIGFGESVCAAEPSLAGFHAHKFWRGHDRLCHFEIQAGGVGLQRP